MPTVAFRLDEIGTLPCTLVPRPGTGDLEPPSQDVDSLTHAGPGSSAWLTTLTTAVIDAVQGEGRTYVGP